ncbi:PREDICTED: T-cell-interacting, activating receptor on myeloid cells protein 1 [Dipodomys ordii]|uniref:T-cell-interacting, activating receptor on myeloid cells protein 1 n=1 Tax=Dipodomys ordii TaxID=10020 RepID=UPI0006504B49|nr:PREDICTED: T-cell-interacting, activating receptor on myeloid cells protein 1 [Dipodomys ordii]
MSGSGPFPKPVLQAQPGSVVPPGSNITLQCTSPILGSRFVLRKGVKALGAGHPRFATQWRQGGVDFQLTELQLSDTGPYTCEQHTPGSPDPGAQLSEVLLLLVTGASPSPSLQSHSGDRVALGGQMTLRCQRPDNRTDNTTFALLKEGAASPIQIQHSPGGSMAFTLTRVTGADSGRYRCVYLQTQAPSWASSPSEALQVMVAGFPKPRLSAWPSSVVPAGGQVTLKCSSPTPGMRLVLRKEARRWSARLANPLTEGTAEFPLTDLGLGDMGPYTCEYYWKGSPGLVSEPSEALMLLITGTSPSPSLRSHLGDRVALGGQVTLRCQRPDKRTDNTTFALLKEGAASPIQIQHSPGGSVAFTLSRVTGTDTGRYRCVYLQTQALSWASSPSEALQVVVAAPLSAIARGRHKCLVIRLGMAAMVVALLGIFLAEAWHSWGDLPGNPAPHPKSLAQAFGFARKSSMHRMQGKTWSQMPSCRRKLRTHDTERPEHQSPAYRTHGAQFQRLCPTPHPKLPAGHGHRQVGSHGNPDPEPALSGTEASPEWLQPSWAVELVLTEPASPSPVGCCGFMRSGKFC